MTNVHNIHYRYMKRRCAFLDKMPAFVYNIGRGEPLPDGTTSDTTKLGSTLMSTMLQEVKNLCKHDVKYRWSQKAHQQVYGI